MRPGLRKKATFVINTVPSENGDRERSLSYPGWRVVLAAFFGVMVSFAAVVPYTFSLFLAPLHEAFGWKREGISMAFGITAMTVASAHLASVICWTDFPREGSSCPRL